MKPLKPSTVLTYALSASADGYWWKQRPAADRERVELATPAPRYRSSHSSVGDAVSIQTWQLPGFSLGVRLWWTICDIMMCFHSGLHPDQVVKYMLNSWTRWCDHSSNRAPEYLCLRKGLDRRGRVRDWSRWCPEHSCSTTGLRLLLVNQILSCRTPEPNEIVDFLSRWLERQLLGADCDLVLPLQPEIGRAYCHAGSSVPVHSGARLPVVGHEVWIGPLLSQAEDNVKVHLQVLFERLLSEGRCDDEKCGVGILLVAFVRHRWLDWLGAGFLFQIARLVEAHDKPENIRQIRPKVIGSGEAA